MPLTHLCGSFTGQDIVRDGKIDPAPCQVFNRSLAYLFYGRPAYRIGGDNPIRTPAACPMCFIFKPDILERAQEIYPFDTGAFTARLYSHMLIDEMNISDFSLERKLDRPDKLIRAVFGTKEAYYDGQADTTIALGEVPASEFLAEGYLRLVRSSGRNEPDDRVGTVEVMFGDPVPLKDNLLALVVPDAIWSDREKAKWLKDISGLGVEILVYHYVPGRHPEFYHAMVEVEVKRFLAL
jgi:hypothetical protein